MDKLKYKKIKLAKCKERRRKSKTISSFNRTRRDSSEGWKGRGHKKERYQKLKSLSNFGKAFGKKKEKRQTCHGWKR